MLVTLHLLSSFFVQHVLQVINKKFVDKLSTLDNIFAILAWSFQVLTSGQMPSSDHLGQPFLHHWRKKHQEKSLNCTALLVEVRGDWEMFKNTFGLSGWADSGSCCFRCYATKTTMRDCSATAVWRQQRKTTWDHFADTLKTGKQISAIFLHQAYRWIAL